MSHLYNTNSKHRIWFDKGETCASPLSTSLRKKLDISSASPQNHKFKNIKFYFISMRHVPQLDNEDEALITKFQIMKYIY